MSTLLTTEQDVTRLLIEMVQNAVQDWDVVTTPIVAYCEFAMILKYSEVKVWDVRRGIINAIEQCDAGLNGVCTKWMAEILIIQINES